MLVKIQAKGEKIMKRYLLNLDKKTIHNGLSLYYAAKRMKKSNQKWFDKYEEAENYYEGDTDKGHICGVCFKSRAEALELEKK